MKSVILFAATMSAMIVPAPSSAQGSMVQGLGSNKCSAWVSAHKDNSWTAIAQDAWLGGYVSGYNRFFGQGEGDVGRGNPFTGMVGWMTFYCSAHPSDMIADGALAMIMEFNAKRTD